jgi:hypothetical protein
MRILTVTVDPQQSWSDGYNIEEADIDTEGLEYEEIEQLISEEVQNPIVGFPRYGIALNEKQAKKLYKSLQKFLKIKT